MINLMNDNDLVELEIEKEGMRIRLKKTNGEISSMMGPVMSHKERMIEEMRPKEIVAPPEKPAAKTVEIKAPMVGTFYRAPSPEAAPFVESGQIIEPGQVICIIEAMKLMNEIKAEVKGKIMDIIAENAEPVEFGQPLFLIEPL